MSDDFLKQFASALADEHDGATAVPEATRGRVIRALAEKRRRSRKWWVLGVPTFFAGSTAWAAAAGHLPTIIDHATSVFAFHRADEQTPAPQTSSSVRNGQAAPQAGDLPETQPHAPEHATDAPALMDKTDPDLAVPATHTAAKSELVAPPRAAEQAATPQPALDSPPTALDSPPTALDSPPTALDSPPTALSIYRAAHRAQFQEADCSTAILGYQKYLNEDPAGSFALEAKYNRGVCLAKMGRAAEAVSALQPFAEGQFGAYRQDQSRALIEALQMAR